MRICVQNEAGVISQTLLQPFRSANLSPGPAWWRFLLEVGGALKSR